ncbi:hypothetical protein K502DRAFT_345453 [Neoconidiobolus thromboides FSU 785]|nr:hypothetical protein K502DRAFT_345453 [Neoconidiobolus thromboides FSU 785]
MITNILSTTIDNNNIMNNIKCILEDIEISIKRILKEINNIKLYHQIDYINNSELKLIKEELDEQQKLIVDIKDNYLLDQVYDFEKKEYYLLLLDYYNLIVSFQNILSFYWNTNNLLDFRQNQTFKHSFNILNGKLIDKFNKVRVLPVKPYLVKRDFSLSYCV